jgi:hypothetical protein
MNECETWSLVLRKEHRMRVFKNRVLKRKFGQKRDEVTGVRNSNCKGHIRLLFREGAPHQRTLNCLKVRKIWS